MIILSPGALSRAGYPMLKKEVRVIGIDDAPFMKRCRKDVLVVGVVHRGANYFEGVLSTKVRNDGMNATSQLARMVNACKFKRQLRLIMMKGIALAGFYVVAINELHAKTGIPVLVFMRKRPDREQVFLALSYLPDSPKRKRMVEKAGAIHKVGNVYCQLAGLTPERAGEFLRVTTLVGNIPEPLRTAHLIARGVAWGESVGKA